MATMVTKFRPYFTSNELAEVIRCVKSVSHNQALLKNLETYAMKIDRGLLEPNLTLKPSLIDKLDLDSTDQDSSNSSTNYTSERELAFNKYQSNPASCSVKELELAHTYRYENDLMDATEEVEFESKQVY
jgi:hypothetical protein